MRSSLLALPALALLSLRGAAATTCAEKKATNPTEDCVVPYTFPASTTLAGKPLPAGWAGPAPVCYTQYYMNQLATPTFMPSNSYCSAYANRGCCSSEMVMRCAARALRAACAARAPAGAQPGHGHARARRAARHRRTRRRQIGLWRALSRRAFKALTATAGALRACVPTCACAARSIDNEQYGTAGVYPGYGSRCARAPRLGALG
jgi:hypothetical protein